MTNSSFVLEPFGAAAQPPTVTLTKSTPVVLGEGTLLTCSWTDIPDVDYLEYKLESNEVVYSYDIFAEEESKTGILVNATAWPGSDVFYVYINVTQAHHLTSYQCAVSNGDDFLSPFISLVDPGK